MNNNSCAVSVVVPVCNVQKFLRQCLDSLTDQTLQDIQIICVDDGSKDDSLRILQEYAQLDPRIEIISKPNAGYGHTMNRGLAAAKGEYIGVVESDDFAESDMFKKLYALAKQSDADVVKSNYYQYITDSDPKDGLVVENLAGCTYEQIVNPLKEQNIFLTQPAIWSAIYKREFLQREGISFLETPGASFQDTAFNFKVFSTAKRAYFTKDAYLHYRIDNANSSVKSLSKVFCICDEYQEIWRFAEAHPEIYQSLKYRIPQIQLGGYLWNLDRLTPALQHDFYVKLVKEFKEFGQKDLLYASFFDEVAWGKLQGILADPEGYYQACYGPVNPNHTVILILEGKVANNYERSVLATLGVLGQNDELYLYSPHSELMQHPAFTRVISRDGRLYCSDDEIKSCILEEINIESIRGEELVVIRLGGPKWTPRNTSSYLGKLKTVLSSSCGFANCSESWAIASCNVADIKNSDAPVFASLFLDGFYLKQDDSSIEDTHLSWMERLRDDVSVSLEDYTTAYKSFVGLYQWYLSCRDSIGYSKCFDIRSRKAFAIMWQRIRAAYDLLEYNDRVQVERPSLCHLDPWMVKEASTDTEPLVSVVIPVYNSCEFLRPCLDSVLKQDINNIQVICVDDGSTDDSLRILNEYADKDSRVCVVSQLNGGAGSARNLGIKYASGQYLSFIDPDDSYSSENTLSKLFDAASSNNAKIAGGSFALYYPDGKKEEFFGGSRQFYTIRKEGFQSLSGLHSDYGWIRFMFHRTIFTEGKIRFPEYRWYEDPVFLVDVMEYCDEFYGITDSVYRYRAEYKELTWTAAKIRDLLKGISHNLEFAKQKRLPALYTTLVLRLSRDYYDAILEFINDEEVFTLLTNIQASLDFSLLNFMNDSGRTTYLIPPLRDFSTHGTAVVRLAKRVEKSSFYKKLQDIREKVK